MGAHPTLTPSRDPHAAAPAQPGAAPAAGATAVSTAGATTPPVTGTATPPVAGTASPPSPGAVTPPPASARLREDLIHPDPLLDCVVEVCRLHGVGASRASLSAGLPLV